MRVLGPEKIPRTASPESNESDPKDTNSLQVILRSLQTTWVLKKVPFPKPFAFSPIVLCLLKSRADKCAVLAAFLYGSISSRDFSPTVDPEPLWMGGVQTTPAPLGLALRADEACQPRHPLISCVLYLRAMAYGSTRAESLQPMGLELEVSNMLEWHSDAN